MVEGAGVDDVVIVGAGVCGGRTAVALREAKFAGRLTLIGEEPEPPYERPPLSKTALTGTEAPSPSTIYGVSHLADLDIAFVGGARAVGIDRSSRAVALEDGRLFSYDRLLLATGARPRPLTVPGGEAALTLRTFADAERLREVLRAGTRVGIIGGGFIGLEVASSARERGCQVAVVEMAPSIMGRVVPPELAGTMATRHQTAGVHLRCGAGIARIEPDADGVQIVLTDGDVIRCDVVVAGVGALPNTALAEASGLEVDNGIAVDASLRTSDPAIFAAGDCCSFPHPLYDGRRMRLEAWRNALDQAGHVAGNLLGAEAPYGVVPWFWTDQYELGLHIAGLPHAATREVVRRRADGVLLRFGLDGSGRLVAASGVADGTAIAKDIRLAELLIAKQASPEPGRLADPDVSLKALLRS